MISSPVERMATIGLRQTSTAATPIAASTPVSRLVSSWPRRSTVSPAVISVPANDTPLPAVTALAIRSSRPLRLGVLDHDHGIGAARHHPAGGNRHGRARPNRPSSARRRCESFPRQAARVRGTSSDAPNVSSATTAKPSTFERSNDGTSTGETTSAASTRPSAASSGTRLDAARRQVDRRAKAPLGLVAIEHVEKLLLLTHRARPPRRRRRRSPRCRRGR